VWWAAGRAGRHRRHRPWCLLVAHRRGGGLVSSHAAIHRHQSGTRLRAAAWNRPRHAWRTP